MMHAPNTIMNLPEHQAITKGVEHFSVSRQIVPRN